MSGAGLLASIESKLPHFARGKIVKGFGRGSTELGFPTANFDEAVIEQLPEELVALMEDMKSAQKKANLEENGKESLSLLTQ